MRTPLGLAALLFCVVHCNSPSNVPPGPAGAPGQPVPPGDAPKNSAQPNAADSSVPTAPGQDAQSTAEGSFELTSGPPASGGAGSTGGTAGTKSTASTATTAGSSGQTLPGD